MQTLIASFSSEHSAEAARRALVDAGVDNSRIRAAPAVAANAPEPVSPDEPVEVSPEPAVSPGAEESGSTTLKGSAVGGAIGAAIGVATTPFLGPIGIAAGAGVGAYAGSLVGALSGLEAAEVDPEGTRVVPATDDDARTEVRTTLTIAVADEDRQRAQSIVQTFGAEVEDNFR